MTNKIRAEIIGTFWLVFCGCGSAVLAAAFPQLGIGFLGVALAFGLTVMTMAYALGAISGAHFNPAVTIGLYAAGRFPGSQVLSYIVAQLIGALAASALLFLIASGRPDFSLAAGFAANGYGAHSPGGYSLWACLVLEAVLTGGFVLVITAVTSRASLQSVAPIAIGLTLTLALLVSIPVTNASINPARSTGPAIIAGGWALQQLWLFWLAPIIGGAAGGLLARELIEEEQQEQAVGPTGTVPLHEEEGPKAANY